MFLPHQVQGAVIRGQAKTPREAMDQACRLYAHLPLPAEAFVNEPVCQLRNHFGAQTALQVVAEKVPRVPDTNRAPQARVDFFCYYADGRVVRHHPGRNDAQDMQPHTMHPGCNLYYLPDAREEGVGAVLHRYAPGFMPDAGAPQPGVMLCSRADMNRLCTFDVQTLAWRHIRGALDTLPAVAGEVDWSDGAAFPCWVFLARKGKIHDIVGDGIFRVRAVVQGNIRGIIVTTTTGQYLLSGNPQKCTIEPYEAPPQ